MSEGDAAAATGQGGNPTRNNAPTGAANPSGTDNSAPSSRGSADASPNSYRGGGRGRGRGGGGGGRGGGDGGGFSHRVTRCKFYPNCVRGDSCNYFHPNQMCQYHPNCRNTAFTCMFIHPDMSPAVPSSGGRRRGGARRGGNRGRGGYMNRTSPGALGRGVHIPNNNNNNNNNNNGGGGVGGGGRGVRAPQPHMLNMSAPMGLYGVGRGQMMNAPAWANNNNTATNPSDGSVFSEDTRPPSTNSSHSNTRTPSPRIDGFSPVGPVQHGFNPMLGGQMFFGPDGMPFMTQQEPVPIDVFGWVMSLATQLNQNIAVNAPLPSNGDVHGALNYLSACVGGANAQLEQNKALFNRSQQVEARCAQLEQHVASLTAFNGALQTDLVSAMNASSADEPPPPMEIQKIDSLVDLMTPIQPEDTPDVDFVDFTAEQLIAAVAASENNDYPDIDTSQLAAIYSRSTDSSRFSSVKSDKSGKSGKSRSSSTSSSTSSSSSSSSSYKTDQKGVSKGERGELHTEEASEDDDPGKYQDAEAGSTVEQDDPAGDDEPDVDSEESVMSEVDGDDGGNDDRANERSDQDYDDDYNAYDDYEEGEGEEEYSGFVDAFPYEENLFALNFRFAFIERVATNDDAIVYSAIERDTNRKVAIKIASGYEEDREPKEVKILSLIQGHICVPRLICWLPLPETECYAMVTHFIESIRVDGTNPKLIQRVVYDVLLALQHCQANGILYRDVKPSNVLFDKHLRRAVTIDYDCSTFFDPENLHRGEVGTDGYMAPEIVEITKARKKKLPLPYKGYGYPIDVYSVGIMFGELLFLIDDEGETTRDEFLALVAGLKKRTPAHNLLLRMLEENPDKRITVEDALAHPYFADLPPVRTRGARSLLPGYENVPDDEDDETEDEEGDDDDEGSEDYN